jgi:2'-5' RNA ligase
MRLFVAIELDDNLKKTITGTLHDLKKSGVKGSYVASNNLHLTLAFIGEVEDALEIKNALQTISCKPFKLSLSDLGNFGDILWIGVKGNQGLSAAAKAVRDALDDAGIAYDREKFVTHITLIRKVSGSWKQVPAPKGEMKVTKLSLMKTTFRDGKPVYTEHMGI